MTEFAQQCRSMKSSSTLSATELMPSVFKEESLLLFELSNYLEYNGLSDPLFKVLVVCGYLVNGSNFSFSSLPDLHKQSFTSKFRCNFTFNLGCTDAQASICQRNKCTYIHCCQSKKRRFSRRNSLCDWISYSYSPIPRRTSKSFSQDEFTICDRLCASICFYVRITFSNVPV